MKTKVTISHIRELVKKSSVTKGLENLENTAKDFKTGLVGEVLYFTEDFTTGTGVNVYMAKPTVFYNKNNNPSIGYQGDVKIGYIKE